MKSDLLGDIVDELSSVTSFFGRFSSSIAVFFNFFRLPETLLL